MAAASGKVTPPEHSLTRMFYEEAMTPFLVLSLMMGTAGCAAVILVWRISAFGYVGLVGVSRYGFAMLLILFHVMNKTNAHFHSSTDPLS